MTIIVLVMFGTVGAIVFGYLVFRRRYALRGRVANGNLYRFDSVTKLEKFCRERYQTDHVHSSSESGEFLLQVELPGGESFESLIVHFDGEGTYAVRLPEK